jgi:two-component system OmpR family response regulator
MESLISERKPKLLVVDDERPITDLIATAISLDGYEVDIANSGIEAINKLDTKNYDLVILDVMMPDFSGNYVLQRMRNNQLDTPVIFLTARDSTEDKIAGLSLGADDYITKPFSLEELSLRIKVILKRYLATETNSKMLSAYDIELNLDTFEVMRQGNLIQLTALEFSLLKYLVIHVNKVVSKSELLEEVWGLDMYSDPNLVETYISYLRKKIDIYEPQVIQTVRGIGYSLREMKNREVNRRVR